jgi:hypothetical protein
MVSDTLCCIFRIYMYMYIYVYIFERLSSNLFIKFCVCLHILLEVFIWSLEYEQPKISISISLSGNVVITIHVLPVCSGRPDLDLWNGTRDAQVHVTISVPLRERMFAISSLHFSLERQIGILSLFKWSPAHLVHCPLSSRWKIVAWGRCFFELVQTMWSTHGVHHLFSCMSENSLLGQVEFRACAIFTHAWRPQCVFFRDGKFLLEAGGILRLCNYSWKSDWRLFCYTRMVCAVCLLSRWKIVGEGSWNLELVQTM